MLLSPPCVHSRGGSFSADLQALSAGWPALSGTGGEREQINVNGFLYLRLINYSS